MKKNIAKLNKIHSYIKYLEDCKKQNREAIFTGREMDYLLLLLGEASKGFKEKSRDIVVTFKDDNIIMIENAIRMYHTNKMCCVITMEGGKCIVHNIPIDIIQRITRC